MKLFEWYRKRSAQAAADFVSELERAVCEVTEHPERWPAYLQGTQRYKLERFPHALVYLVRDDSILGLAVAHLNRRPGYWRSRLK